MNWIVSGLFIGRVRSMPGDGRPTGMLKAPVSGPVEIGIEGLIGDAQADRRVHGGPEKAVHHFPAAHYRRIAARFPQLAEQCRPGTLGENLSTEGADETEVCIGDVFALGSARLQVSQPRRPCWKIDARLGEEGVAAYVAQEGIAGWYYRVLTPGMAQAGDALTLLDREWEPVSLRELCTLMATPRPPLGALERLAESPALNVDWRARLKQRLDWLRANS